MTIISLVFCAFGFVAVFAIGIYNIPIARIGFSLAGAFLMMAWLAIDTQVSNFSRGNDILLATNGRKENGSLTRRSHFHRSATFYRHSLRFLVHFTSFWN